MKAGFDLLPRNWREQAEELDDERTKHINEPEGVHDWTCLMTEVPTMGIVLNEEGERKVFLLRNPVYAG